MAPVGVIGACSRHRKCAPAGMVNGEDRGLWCFASFLSRKDPATLYWRGSESLGWTYNGEPVKLLRTGLADGLRGFHVEFFDYLRPWVR